MADITIPRSALEAGITAFAKAEANDYTSQAEDLATAFLAMLAAWPNAFEYRSAHANYGQCLSLPLLPQENPDAEA